MIKENCFQVDKTNGFLFYEPTSNDMQSVEFLYEKLYPDGKLNDRTVYVGKTPRIAGLLGELVFEKLFYPNTTYVGDKVRGYDFVVDNYLGIDGTVDVKCKSRGVPPKKDYDASILNSQSSNFFNTKYYVFMSTTRFFDRVWICGYYSKEEFINGIHTTKWSKGQVDPSNGKVFAEDSYNVLYKYLNQFEV